MVDFLNNLFDFEFMINGFQIFFEKVYPYFAGLLALILIIGFLTGLSKERKND